MAIRDLIPWRKQRHGEESGLPVRREFEDWIHDFFEDFLRPWSSVPSRRGWQELGLSPAVDVSETDNEYKVSVELPGIRKEDIDVTIDEGRLSIRGEKREEEKEEEQDFLRVERSYGAFQRTIPLPQHVDEEAVEASFQDGVLSVVLPKTEQARGRRVEITGQ